MSRIEQIRERLAALQPLKIEIEDDSHLHAGHAGAQSGGSHFRLHIVSGQFAGKNTLARHRMKNRRTSTSNEDQYAETFQIRRTRHG